MSTQPGALLCFGDDELGKKEVALESVNYLLLKFLCCERLKYGVLILDPQAWMLPGEGACNTLRHMLGNGVLVFSSII